MLSGHFIKRPILSSVVALFIFLAGIVSIYLLPIEQFPNLLPPQISVQTNYAGGSAETVATSVGAPLEQQVNQAENLIYMYSNSSATGDYVLNVFFKSGTDIDTALIDVQNQMQIAMPLLPEEVQRAGVAVRKQTSSILLVIGLQAEENRYSETYLSNYASINIVDELQRTPGVSKVHIINDRTWAMRIWIDPVLLAKYSLTTEDVARAIHEQNSAYAVGRLGEPPTVGPIEMTLSMESVGRLSSKEEFEEIILKATANGAIVYLKDVATVELGAQSYSVASRLNGVPNISIAIFQQFGANALAVSETIKNKMKELSERFPDGINYSIPYDPTAFVIASIREVVKTIFEAGFFVSLIVFIFLKSFRLTIIPVQAMIISIVGTFAGLFALGLTINTLTLFGIVLAIGIVVDDAIVVIENIERNLHIKKMSPIDAAHEAMDEVTSPIIAIMLVLSSVFIPVAFLGGITGLLYRQFAFTIVISVILSTFIALTLSPALSARLITKRKEPGKIGKKFDAFLDKVTELYIQGASWLLHYPKVGMGLFALCLGLTYLMIVTIPTSFVPEEDQGYLITMINLPEGASLTRTEAVGNETSRIALENPAVSHVFEFAGYSFIDGLNRTNQGTNFINLHNWDERKAPDEHALALLNSLSKKYSKIPEGRVYVFNPPAIQGLGTVGGFEFWLQNRGNGDYAFLEEITQRFIQKASERPELTNLFSTIDANAPQIYIDLDRAKARALNIPIESIYHTLQTLFGSYYINNFNMFGRVYRVIAMGKPSLRETPNDVENVYVRSQKGDMVSLKSLVNMKQKAGANLISRFNGFPSAKINGAAASGFSSGEALIALEEVAREVLPQDVSYAFSGSSYQEKESSGSSEIMLIASFVMIFLILAGLYERWNLPLAVLLAVPFGLFGSFFIIWLVSMSSDIYFQIGLITIVALSAKNAILIVEFAIIKYEEGMPLIDAALEAGRLRFRAIMMTSLTFIFGVLPLIFSSGAGASSRISVGMGVLGGMISATFLAIFFVPLFFCIILEWTEKRRADA